MLGHEPTDRFGLLRESELRARAAALMNQTGLHVPLDDLTGALGVGAKQRVEILRILLRGARTVLLDEPTAILLPQEVKALYELLRGLADGGAAVGIVTHYVQETLAYADDVTVLRKGRVVSSGRVAEHTAESLSRAMLGEIPAAPLRPALLADAPPLLEVEGLSTEHAISSASPASRRGALRDVSFAVRAGEILGVAGIDGNGQEALVSALAGLAPAVAGRLSLGGTSLRALGIRERRAAGLEVIHGDRHRFGMVEEAMVGDNLVLGDPDQRWPRDREAAIVQERLARSGAVPAEASRTMATMSGGNQQKIVVERALSRDPKVLVASYPTRGVDAAAAAAIRSKIVDHAKQGAGVLLVSADLAELRSLSHRLLVFVDGRIAATFDRDPSEDELGAAMLSRGTAAT
jgi:simple sugar transport system ATP-binding protein